MHPTPEAAKVVLQDIVNSCSIIVRAHRILNLTRVHLGRANAGSAPTDLMAILIYGHRQLIVDIWRLREALLKYANKYQMTFCTKDWTRSFRVPMLADDCSEIFIARKQELAKNKYYDIFVDLLGRPARSGSGRPTQEGLKILKDRIATVFAKLEDYRHQIAHWDRIEKVYGIPPLEDIDAIWNEASKIIDGFAHLCGIGGPGTTIFAFHGDLNIIAQSFAGLMHV